MEQTIVIFKEVSTTMHTFTIESKNSDSCLDKLTVDMENTDCIDDISIFAKKLGLKIINHDSRWIKTEITYYDNYIKRAEDK